MLTKERATTGDKPIPISRYYGTTAALRVVNGADWSDMAYPVE
jgi:hypothetical protein